MNRQGGYITQLNGYKAFVPSPLPPMPSLDLNEELVKKNEQAVMALARLDGIAFLLPNLDLFITMYVKKEALISSQIEGTQASLEDIFEYESGVDIDNVNDVKEVVNYIKAMNYGIDRLQTLPMSLRFIKELHAILLQDTRGKHKTPGEFKRSQNWIGPSGATLQNATFVPPSPEDALQAMSDLERYMHEESGYPILINCALLHYQFETIHPFLDGNGRLGRLLITLYLFWQGAIEKPILYASYYLKKHRQEYSDRLMMVRNKGNYEQWVFFFLESIIEACESAISDTKHILVLKSEDERLLWENRISSPFATMLLNQLFLTPIISTKDIEKGFGVSYPTAANVIKQFIEMNILKEITGQKRAKRYVYMRYMDILSEGAHSL